MEFTGTFCPEDNKLRLYAATRLEPELYARVKAAGFIWAPKQDLFVAPMWTPEREELLLGLCGEIGDEDTSLVERAEERAERFEEYSEKRGEEADRAHDSVKAITDHIPLGQPILVGHHSERHARKDAERIENGMRKAVNLWETSKYWESRAKGALRHAKYKERPDVRARRIKGLEADKRKQERTKKEAETFLKMWDTEGLTLENARRISNYCRLYLINDGQFNWSAWDVLRPDGERYSTCPSWTVEQVQEAARRQYPAIIAHCDRWLQHIENRLLYEKTMLEEQGASALIAKKPRPTQLPLCNYRQESFQIENQYHKGSFETYTQIEMTGEEYAKIYQDYKGTRIIDHSHRVRVCMRQGKRSVIFLTDSKVHEKPEPITQEEQPQPVRPHYNYTAPEPTKFDDLKETLKAGVQVVVADQLFPTPPEIADRMVALADIQEGERVLEPSAGTGNILAALVKASVPLENIVAVEENQNLVTALYKKYVTTPIYKKDFLLFNDSPFSLGTFDKIVMNPPFSQGDDVKHILHARNFLKLGGKIVALCANGPRQSEKLRPLATTWETLPEGSFSDQGTMVNAVMLTMGKV